MIDSRERDGERLLHCPGQVSFAVLKKAHDPIKCAFITAPPASTSATASRAPPASQQTRACAMGSAGSATLLFLIATFLSPSFSLELFPLTAPRCGDVVDADAVLISWDAFDESGHPAAAVLILLRLLVAGTPPSRFFYFILAFQLMSSLTAT
jgi:hypothetical protein